MSTDIIIRPYEKRDRDIVRQICGDTANRGEPVESFFPDRQLIVDLVSSYYTDHEPNSLWVAQLEPNGKVVGYLTGCLDNRRYNFMMTWCVAPQAIFRAVVHGVLFQRETWQLFLVFLKTWWVGGFSKNIPTQKYPAHLHINISNGFRGKHIGQKLMERFFLQVTSSGLHGTHVITREDNISACNFFEKVGFVIVSRHPMFALNHGSYQFSHTIVYGKEL